jgi:endonuclease YncB( thermonuclease family)
MTDQRQPRGNASKPRPRPSAYIKCAVHQRDGYNEILAQVATTAAAEWLVTEGQHLGVVARIGAKGVRQIEDITPGSYVVRISPSFDAQEVAEYLESYTEEA